MSFIFTYWFIITLLILGLIAVFVYFQPKALISHRDGFVILGLRNSGKTTLFGMLKTGQILPTQTSTKINEAYIQPVDFEGLPLTQDKIKIIDVPGHDKLRNIIGPEQLNNSKAVLITIDASTVARNTSSVAEMVYDILIDKNVIKSKLPILFVSTKTDLITAAPLTKLKALLEKELDQLRFTRTSQQLDQLGDETDSKPEASEFLGYEDEPFKFHDLPQVPEFLELALPPATLMQNQEKVSELQIDRVAAITDWLASH